MAWTFKRDLRLSSFRSFIPTFPGLPFPGYLPFTFQVFLKLLRTALRTQGGDQPHPVVPCVLILSTAFGFCAAVPLCPAVLTPHCPSNRRAALPGLSLGSLGCRELPCSSPCHEWAATKAGGGPSVHTFTILLGAGRC